MATPGRERPGLPPVASAGKVKGNDFSGVSVLPALDHILAANKEFAATFDWEQACQSALPTRKIAIVACMDARINPPVALGLEPGEAHIIRNAGGRVIEALRSIAISQQLLGTEELAIIHHTRCGMSTFTDLDIRQRLRENLDADADHIAFLPFTDLEQSVRDDIRIYAESPIVRHDIPVHGLIYEVETGLLHRVE
jgi:carbonic anhydrase